MISMINLEIVTDALEFAFNASESKWVDQKITPALAICEAALAGQGEPIGYAYENQDFIGSVIGAKGDWAPHEIPLFTHPASKPLEPDKDLTQALTERDEYHDMADKLAEGIALHFDGDIGEHSSSNSPWDRALDLLDSAACAETMRLTRPASKPEKLTDEEIKRIQMSDPAYMTCSCPAFARQVEAAVWAKFAAVKQDEAIKEKFE